MKQIELRNGGIALVSDEDYPNISSHKWWGISVCGGHRYAERHIKVGGKWTTITMHREIMQTPKGMDTDHINGDSLDNRRTNLRICHRSQNALNRRVDRRNKTGYRNISKRLDGKFVAQVKLDKKHHWIGAFDTALEAAKAYNDFVGAHFNAFARLNTIPDK